VSVPDHDSRARLVHLPARRLFDPVMPAADGPTIAFAGPTALVEWHCVLVVAGGSGAAAAGGGARRVADGEQVTEPSAGLVGSGLPGVLALAAFEPFEGQAGEPAAAGFCRQRRAGCAGRPRGAGGH